MHTALHHSGFLCCPGDAETAAGFARQLLSLGADPNLRSRWTNMRALHYAAYFDVPQLICVVLQASQPGGERPAAVRAAGGEGHPDSPSRGDVFIFNTQLQWGLTVGTNTLRCQLLYSFKSSSLQHPCGAA